MLQYVPRFILVSIICHCIWLLYFQLLIIDFFFFLTITDINECVLKDLNNCKSNQDCINEPGSYRCSCIGGYHPDGEACVADQPAPKSSLAINLTVGKYI